MELVVSVSIMVIVSTVFLANYHLYGSRGTLNATVQKVATDIRQVQGFSLGLKQFNGSTPLGGWGAYFSSQNPDRTHYSIFADVDENKICQSNCTPSVNEFLKSLDLSKGVETDQIILTDVNGSPTTVNRIDLVYVPPDPKIFICGNVSQCDYIKGEIIFKNTSGATSSVIVNTLGLVDVKN